MLDNRGRGDNFGLGNTMTANLQRESLEEAFKRIRGVDASLGEQLQAFAESARRRRPEFAAAIDRHSRSAAARPARILGADQQEAREHA